MGEARHRCEIAIAKGIGSSPGLSLPENEQSLNIMIAKAVYYPRIETQEGHNPLWPHLLDTIWVFYAPFSVISLVRRAMKQRVIAIRATGTSRYHIKIRKMRSLGMMVFGLAVTFINVALAVYMINSRHWQAFSSFHSSCVTAQVSEHRQPDQEDRSS